jgi:hypothetical protein
MVMSYHANWKVLKKNLFFYHYEHVMTLHCMNNGIASPAKMRGLSRNLRDRNDKKSGFSAVFNLRD